MRLTVRSVRRRYLMLPRSLLSATAQKGSVSQRRISVCIAGAPDSTSAPATLLMPYRISPMANLPLGVIPISADEYDRLYPRYQLETKSGESFQTWLKRHRQQQTRRKVALVKS